MTSLTDVYEGDRSGLPNRRRLLAGVGLFGGGVVFVVASIVLATTQVGNGALGLYGARELAGILGGTGLLAGMLGIFVVLPASRRIRAAAVIGTGVAMLGVALFWEVYPYQWYGTGRSLTLPVVAVYFLGIAITFWCLFTAVASFKTRNNPGGTVTLEITRGGETRVVEVSNDELEERLSSGIGLLGATPDGEAETQTNRPDARTASDGGSVDVPVGDGTDAEFVDEPETTTEPDAYCGNCAHFSYVRTNDGLQPYCGAHEEYMDDMEPCSQWERN